MSYYWFNRKELLEKAHRKYHKEGDKEQATRYYKENKEAITKKSKRKVQKIEQRRKRQKKRIFTKQIP